MLIAQLLWSTRATLTPGTVRSKSGIFVMPERRMSSCVITKIAAPVFASFCSFLETDVTWTFIRSSRLNCVRSRGVGVWPATGMATPKLRPRVIPIRTRGMTILRPTPPTGSDSDIRPLSVRWRLSRTQWQMRQDMRCDSIRCNHNIRPGRWLPSATTCPLWSDHENSMTLPQFSLRHVFRARFQGQSGNTRKQCTLVSWEVLKTSPYPLRPRP